MPRTDGLEATRRLAGLCIADPIRVVVVTTFDLDDYVHDSLRNGAAGLLLKDAGPTLLLEAQPLTDREAEVLREAALGRSNAEIATELFISLGTVKTHLSSLQDEIGAWNRVELAAFAWKSGRMR